MPGTSAGHFCVSNHPDLILATWHELAHHGVTLFGPDVATLDIRTDDTATKVVAAQIHEALTAPATPAPPKRPTE